MSDQIALADSLAAQAHAGQQYGNEPYINHPRRVAERVRRAGGSKEHIAAALLHDVIEDCGVTPQQLREAGVSAGVIALVVGLSRKVVDGRKELYHREFIQRCALDPELRLIKREDILENDEHLPGAFPPDQVAGMRRRYARALAILDAAEQAQ